MRQRRQQLQVSTFPFLAVLLCTMGSLILLLLVIDRRAKAVARAKALQAASLAAEDAQAVAERAAELERRRQALHVQLFYEAQELVAQVRTVQGSAEAADKDVQAEQARIKELSDRLQAESTRLEQEQTTVAANQADAAQAAQMSQASRAELARLAATLAQLERTLADLKAARQRERQTYSLVPYKGRRGDNRRPLYIECTADGLIFHPDRLALGGLGVSAADIRAEVERRIARQKAALVAVSAKPEETAYLLMLVRPDGILSYYRALSALEGLKIDFGYEFVERDWVLDFPDAADAAPQPWMTADTSPSGRPSALPTTPRLTHPQPVPIQSSGRVQGVALGAGVRDGSPRTGDGSTEGGGGGFGLPGGIASGPGGGVQARGTFFGTSQNPGAAGQQEGSSAGNGWQSKGTGFGPSHGPGIPGQQGGTGFGTGQPPNGHPPGTGTWGAAGSPTFADHSPQPNAQEPSATVGFAGSSGQPGSGGVHPTADGSLHPGQGTGVASSAFPGDSDHTGQAMSGPVGGGGRPGSSLPGVAPGGQSSGVGAGGVSQGNGPSNPSFSLPGQSGAGGPSLAGPGSRSGLQPAGPQQGASVGPGTGGPGSGLPPAGNQPAPGGSSSPASPGPASATEGAGPTQVSGESSAGGAGMATSETQKYPGPEGRGDVSVPWASPQGLPAKPGRPLPVRPSQMIGNRDFVVAIECTSDSLILYPGRQRFATSVVDQPRENPLVLAIRQVIQRRQASLRPGEPPYRPLLRFLVRPDGMRSYYQAYPALDALHLPMTRVSLAADEDAARHLFDR